MQYSWLDWRCLCALGWIGACVSISVTACQGSDEPVREGVPDSTSTGGDSSDGGSGGSAPAGNTSTAQGGSAGSAAGADGLGGGAGEAGSGNADDEQRISDGDVHVLLNPYGETPLAALLVVDTGALNLDAVRVIEITVEGQRGGEPLKATLDVTSESYFDSFDASDLVQDDQLGIPVLGLFQSAQNRVTFRIGDGTAWAVGNATIEVGEVYSDTVTVHRADSSAMEPGFTFVGGPGGAARVYDRRGELRWVGPRILHIAEDGNVLVGLRKINWLGKTLKRWSLPETLSFHHDSLELAGGHLLVCADNAATTVRDGQGQEVSSIHDYVVELDEQSNIVDAWDLREFLDVDRQTVSIRGGDWVHVNTIAYDAESHSLYVSCRYQGLVKISGRSAPGAAPESGKSLEWILAPHMGWGLAGADGSGPLDPNDYLLTAVDSSGAAYDGDVQNNLAAPSPEDDDFHWPIGEHGIVLAGRDGERLSVLTFDNQASFLFDGQDSINNGSSFDQVGDLSNDRSEEPYSAMIMYEIDEKAMTVRQSFSYGEEQPELYGSYNGGVNLFARTGNLMMISNGSSQHLADLGLNPHLVELSAQGDVVFHLELEDTELSAYRGGRVDLYHPAPPR